MGTKKEPIACELGQSSGDGGEEKNRGLCRRLKSTGLVNNALWMSWRRGRGRNELDDSSLAAVNDATYWDREATLKGSFRSDSECR